MQNHQPTNPHHYYFYYYYHSFTLYQNKHPHTIINSQLAQLWLTLIHSLTPNSLPNPKTPSLSLSLWFHGTQRLTPSLQPSVDSVEKSPPKKTKTKKNLFSLLTFSHFSTNRMARLHWTLFPSSLLLLLLLLLCLLPLLHASAGDSDPIYRQVSSLSPSNFPWFSNFSMVEF